MKKFYCIHYLDLPLFIHTENNNFLEPFIDSQECIHDVFKFCLYHGLNIYIPYPETISQIYPYIALYKMRFLYHNIIIKPKDLMDIV